MRTKRTQKRAYPCFFTDRQGGKGFHEVAWKAAHAILAVFLTLSLLHGSGAKAIAAKNNVFPIERDALVASLSRARSPSPTGTEISYPHEVTYTYDKYDMMAGEIKEETRTVIIDKKPTRIISHAVGITEILWAICPRERIVAFHETCKEPEFSFLAGKLPPSANCFGTQDAELVIGHHPDLVLTTYYSSPEFRERLKSASLKYAETGYFGSVASIERQILLIGELIGEKANAEFLVEKMENHIETVKKFTEKQGDGRKPSVMYYDDRGYVAGLNTTFDSICNVLGLVNIASVHKVNAFQQVEYEQVLKWDPDAIVVPAESNLQERLYSEKILQTTKAVQHRHIKKVPLVYLYASSQYIVASINYIAGILYAE